MEHGSNEKTRTQKMRKENPSEPAEP